MVSLEEINNSFDKLPSNFLGNIVKASNKFKSATTVAYM